MKKFVSCLLAIVMIAILSVSVYAVNGLGAGGTDSADVKGTYQPASAAETIYSVDIKWEGLNFTYLEGGKGIWNPDTHSYNGSSEAGWSSGIGKITITNHSNAAVTAAASYAAAKGFETAGVSFSKNNFVIATADNGNGGPGTAVTDAVTVAPSGTLPEGTKDVVIGTITIKIS